MARDETKKEDEYQPLAINSEALWALVAVLTMTVFLEVFSWL